MGAKTVYIGETEKTVPAFQKKRPSLRSQLPPPLVLNSQGSRLPAEKLSGELCSLRGRGVFLQKDHGRYAAATAKRTAGSILATRTFFPHTRFRPTQKIRTDPIRER